MVKNLPAMQEALVRSLRCEGWSSSVFGAERRGCKRGFLSAHRVGIVECREPQAIQAPEQQADARMQDRS